MRVLLISHTCQSRTEGQPKAECLAQLPGMELRVLSPRRWKHYGSWRMADVPEQAAFDYVAGEVAWPWLGPAQYYLHWYPRLARMLLDFRPDVIDLWEEPWGLVSAQVCWLRNRFLPQARIISETEQNINKTLPFPFENLRAYTLRNADQVIGRNEQAVEILRAKGFRGPAEVVPNAVDAELFRPLDRATCRQSLGLSGFVAGYVGRLVEEKGLMDMVDALPACAPEVNLLFVGSGPFQSRLAQRSGELGMTERVRFLSSRPLTELPVVMNAMDTLVLPSRTTSRWKEQFGRVLIEAHACGTPTIGSDSGAIPEVVGSAGLVAPERNPLKLAEAMNRMSADAEARKAMGQAGRAQVEARYTWQQIARRMHGIYSSLLAAPAPRRSPALAEPVISRQPE